jgi:hypothetical protein
MNSHAPENAKIKHVSWEFRGVPFIRNGKKYLKARHRTLNMEWYYSFEDDEIYEFVINKNREE